MMALRTKTERGVYAVKRAIAAVVLLLLLGSLCACSLEGSLPLPWAREASPAPSPAPAGESAAPAPEPSPSPSPTPEPEIRTEILLRDDPLPEDYRLLDWAACENSTLDAQTWIDTGVIPTNDTRFYLDFQCLSGFQVKDTWFFGCFDRDKHLYMEAGYHMGQGNEAHFYTATGVHYSQTEDSAARTVAWLRPGDYRYPDVVHGRTLTAFEEPVEQHLFLFSRQHMDRTVAGTHDIVGHYSLRIYACRIWQEGVCVRDYVPCLRLNDGRVGMYELVQGRACFSDGTEELLPGETLLPERSVPALNGELTESVTPPELPGFLFTGYYTGPEGTGERIVDEKGAPCAAAGTEPDLVLYAGWTRDEAYFDRY